jgi:hypothetical protein
LSAEAAGSTGYDAQGWRREVQVHSISGRSAVYFVDSHMSGRWRCTCPDYLVRRQNSARTASTSGWQGMLR